MFLKHRLKIKLVIYKRHLPVLFKKTMKTYTVKNMKKIKKTFDEAKSIW